MEGESAAFCSGHGAVIESYQGGFEGPQPSKMKPYRPALRAGNCSPERKHFLSIWRKRPPQADFFTMLEDRFVTIFFRV